MQPVKTKKKLSRADRKQIEAAIARANRTDKKEKSAQDSIPYERMWPDGICRVSDGHYTKTIQFQDINYQLSQNEDKTAIFEGWCDFLNYFDSSIQFELSFLNLAASEETFARAINIPLQRDDFDSIRVEYTTMLQNQLAKGNNGLIKTKYLTFGIDADSIKAAKPRLERIETDILNNFKRLGVAAETLDGKARLAQLHGIFHMDEQLPFRFEWDWLPASGLSTKDFIAPSSFEFRTGSQFRMGKKYGAVSFLQILAPELNDRMLADFLDMESSLIVSLHIQSVDQIKAIKTVKRKITDLDKSKIEEQKKAVRAGYDIDIIPSDLATYGVEAKKLLQDLQSRNERMFLVTFLVLNTADNPRQLDNNVFQASSIAQKYNCQLHFTDEERADPALEKPIRKADRAAAKAGKAQAKIRKKQVRQKTVDPKTGKVTTKLVLEDKKKPPSKLSHAVRDAPGDAALGKLHKEIRETEQDNVGVESAHRSEETAETGVRLVREGYRSHKLKPYRKAAQAEQKLEKANVNALYQKSLRENPQLASNPISRWQQKQAIKKEYAAAKRAGNTAGGTAKTASKTAKTAKEKAQQAGAFIMRHKKGFLLVGAIFLLICLLLNTINW